MNILKQPLALHGLTLQNRLVMPPMATHTAAPEGYVTDALLAYYDEKTRGGALGLVITEHAFVSPEGRASANQLSAAEDTCVPGLARLAETIHQNGSPVFLQLNHAGSATNSGITGCPVLGPSALRNPTNQNALAPCREMTPADREKVIADFAAAALRAQKAGMDGVEVHAAHGYLLNQFWSPLTNRRTDAYGGEAAGRLRLTLEVLSAVRRAVGPGYPVALRLGACDYLPGGNGLGEARAAAALLAGEGLCLLDISGGLCRYNRPDSTEPGYFADAALAVKERCGCPVLLTGGVAEPAQADRLLAEGKADLIGVGRALLKDSAWARKAMEQAGDGTVV